MASVKNPFAYDEFQALVYANDIDKASRHEHKYTCPGCGKEMRPRLGEVYQKHFYHFNSDPCDKNLYIHKAAEQILYDRFIKGDFTVSFEKKTKCSLSSACRRFLDGRCSKGESMSLDLAALYSECSIEQWVIDESRFVPDLILKDPSGANPPMFVEVWYTHKSSPAKLNSGNRIMEIHIKGFESLAELKTMPFVEGEDISFYGFDNLVDPNDKELLGATFPDAKCPVVLPTGAQQGPRLCHLCIHGSKSCDLGLKKNNLTAETCPHYEKDSVFAK